MNQAQGAIDAARAAGADQYATTEFTAAVDMLKRSEEAVTQNDYRLALSLAIDSRERAQSAVKIAGSTRAKARGDAERIVTEAAMAVSRARERLSDPAIAKLPRRLLGRPSNTINAAQKSMQEARTALEQDDYRRAIDLATRVSDSVQSALAELDKAVDTPAPRKRR